MKVEGAHMKTSQYQPSARVRWKALHIIPERRKSVGVYDDAGTLRLVVEEPCKNIELRHQQLQNGGTECVLKYSHSMTGILRLGEGFLAFTFDVEYQRRRIMTAEESRGGRKSGWW